MTTAKKTTAKKAAGKKTVAKKSAKKTAAKGGATQCWPGFQPVPGKEPGTKGSCEPKASQTPAEKKADSRAAAASKLEKTGSKNSKG